MLGGGGWGGGWGCFVGGVDALGTGIGGIHCCNVVSDVACRGAFIYYVINFWPILDPPPSCLIKIIMALDPPPPPKMMT